MFIKSSALAALVGLALSGTASAATCVGSCGTSGANGVVTAPPDGSATYDWISTLNGPPSGGNLPGFAGTNGSSLSSDAFFAAAGSTVNFNFNYVTSDGSGFADYAWVELRSTTGNASNVVLFTARTQPEGTIVPGRNLPDVNATLTPPSVPIIPGGPVWAPLGGSSGSCFAAGCGYTDWVNSSYTVTQSDTYELVFGVSNALDQAFDSGLAFSGLLLNGSVIGDGSSADDPLLPSEIGPNGEFVFTFTPTPSAPVFIDPIVAVGYDYKIESGDNSILSAVFPILGGDTDGYQLFSLDGILLGEVLGDEVFNFASPVKGFSLKDIDALLDPTDPTAFVTGLTFANSSEVTVSQKPLTAEVGSGGGGDGDVPEPASLLLVAGGLAALRANRRQRQRAC